MPEPNNLEKMTFISNNGKVFEYPCSYWPYCYDMARILCTVFLVRWTHEWMASSVIPRTGLFHRSAIFGERVECSAYHRASDLRRRAFTAPGELIRRIA